MKYMTMQTIKHIKLNRPEDHCKEDKYYSFTACIKNSLNKKIGCRIQWDEWSDLSWPVCVHRDQFQRFEIEYDKLSRMPRGDLVEYTGCERPCHYREFQTIRDSITVHGTGNGIVFFYPDTEIIVDIEQEIYPFTSFIAEFGGALGLFLGFSFLMIWDLVMEIFEKMRQNIKIQ